MTSLFSSLAQIYLVPSWRAGVVIALALALVFPALAAGALVGAGLGIVCFAVACRRPRRRCPRLAGVAPSATPTDATEFPRRARAGLLGYNGALIGALVIARCGWTLAALIWLALGVFAAVAVHLLLEHLLARFPGAAGLPVLTAPFCAVGIALSLAFPAPAAPPLAGEASLGYALLGLPSAFAQVSLGSGWIPGLLILVALAMTAPRAAAWGVTAVAMTLPVLFFIPVADFGSGAWSYCAALVGIALGATFDGEQAGGSGIRLRRAWPVAAGVACALLIQAFLAWAGWPVLTWPFVIATWVVLAGQGVRRVR